MKAFARRHLWLIALALLQPLPAGREGDGHTLALAMDL